MRYLYDWRWLKVLAWVAVASFAVADSSSAAVLFDDLSASNGGAESAVGPNWLAAGFTTNASSYNQLTAALLLGQTTAGNAQVDLYSDDGLQPGNLLASLTRSSTISSSMANVTFNASALSLSPSTDYWLVLKAPSGEFAWGWTSDSAYTAGWGNSSDSGASWFTDDAFPLQFSVSASAVPEPSPAWTAAVFVSALLVRRRRNETLSSREES